MMKVSRTKAAIKNLVIGSLGQLFNQILGFISRTIFIQMLGVVYLGINGLFSNILSILSLAELGVGSAIIYSLYKPLAEKNTSKIEALMTLYSRAYNMIGATIIILGITLIPFLGFIIKDKPDIPNFIVIFLLYLVNTGASYFFSYKRSLFSADQKEYINIINNNLFNLFSKISQIFVLVITRDFVLYLITQVIFTLLSNLDISNRADKAYPFLKNKTGAKLSRDDYIEIKKNISSMFLLKIGGVLVTGTDNLLISSFIGLVWVGIYSNYVLIISIIQAFINQIFVSLTASVGNLVNLENKDRALDVFYKLFFGNYIIYAVSCINMFILVNPFMELWVGQEYLLSMSTVFLIVTNVYIMGIRRILWIFTNTLGLFHQFRYYPFIEVTINLVVSIILLQRLGIIGVFIGTLVSSIMTYFYSEPHVLYKNYFGVPTRVFFVKYFQYMIIMLIIGSYTGYAVSFINDNNWSGFAIKALLTFTISSISLLTIFYRTKECVYFIDLIKNILSKKS